MSRPPPYGGSGRPMTNGPSPRSKFTELQLGKFAALKLLNRYLIRFRTVQKQFDSAKQHRVGGAGDAVERRRTTSNDVARRRTRSHEVARGRTIPSKTSQNRSNPPVPPRPPATYVEIRPKEDVNLQKRTFLRYFFRVLDAD